MFLYDRILKDPIRSYHTCISNTMNQVSTPSADECFGEHLGIKMVLQEGRLTIGSQPPQRQ